MSSGSGSGPGIIILKPGQHATYIVDKDFSHYLMLEAGATAIIQSKDGNTINLNKNIWGSGHLEILCPFNMVTPLSQPPSVAELQGLPVYTYQGESKFTEEITA